MRVLEIAVKPVERVGEQVRWSCDLIRRDGQASSSTVTLWFESPLSDGASLQDGDAEPFLIASLMLGMQEGRAIRIRGRVSRYLLQNLDEYMAFWSTTAPMLYRRVELQPEQVVDDLAACDSRDVLGTGQAMAAFSGGLDATFLAWRHHTGLAGWRSRQIGFFVMLSGFDIFHDRTTHVDASVESARNTLADIGAELKTLRTNLRQVIPVKWDHLHGTSLVACMHFFKAQARTLLMASCEPYDDLAIPWGMSPITDHLLSSPGLRVIHDSAEFSRTKKAAGVSQWLVGRDNLRVCWGAANPGGNCKRCEKCLRTIANFAVQGLPVPASLGGDERYLNRYITRIKLRTPAQESEWRSLRDQHRSGPKSFWQHWIPVLLMLSKVRRWYYVMRGQPARAGVSRA